MWRFPSSLNLPQPTPHLVTLNQSQLESSVIYLHHRTQDPGSSDTLGSDMWELLVFSLGFNANKGHGGR